MNGATASFDIHDGTARAAGAWTVHTIGDLRRSLPVLSRREKVDVDASEIRVLDTAGAWMLVELARRLGDDGKVTIAGLDEDQERILALVRQREHPEKVERPRRKGILEVAGENTVAEIMVAVGFLEFVGRSAIAAGRVLAARGRFYFREILHVLETAGVNAAPIVGLLSFLIGVVIAYQGITQLSRYGANIFVVDLVAVSVLRELGPLVTAIIVSGRTGSAFAAEIGTMKITEEIDALRVLGISPVELLVLPKFFALIIAVPLLTVFSDAMGIIGGMVMATLSGGISHTAFLDRLPDSIVMSTYLTGIAKTPVFAAIIAGIGCYQGFQVSKGADEVGRHTTIAVVQALFLVIVTDAIFSVVFSYLDI